MSDSPPNQGPGSGSESAPPPAGTTPAAPPPAPAAESAPASPPPAPSPPPARVRPIAPGPKPIPPIQLPVAGPLLALLVLGMAALYYRVGTDLQVHLRMTHQLPSQPGEWWRAVATQFVHGRDQLYTCATTIILSFTYGLRVERVHGRGLALFTFVVGGALANLLRCALGTDDLVAAAPGGVLGVIALIGASAAGAVRLRQPGFFRLVLGGLGSALFAFVFSVVLEHAESIDSILSVELPSVLAAYVIGGLFGTFHPLASRGSRFGIVTALVALAILGAVGAKYGLLVRNALRGGEDPSTPRAKKGPALKTIKDDKLGVEYGIPTTSRELRREARGHEVSYGPFFGGPPIVVVGVYPRDPLKSAEWFAMDIATHAYRVDPKKGILDEGRVELELGEGHHLLIRYEQEDREFRVHVYVIQTRDKLYRVEVVAEPDDATAAALAESVAQSLKPLRQTTDK